MVCFNDMKNIFYLLLYVIIIFINLHIVLIIMQLLKELEV